MICWLHVYGVDAARVIDELYSPPGADVEMDGASWWVKADLEVLLPLFKEVHRLSTTSSYQVKTSIEAERPAAVASPMRLKMRHTDTGMEILTPPPVAITVESHGRRIAALESFVKQVVKHKKLKPTRANLRSSPKPIAPVPVSAPVPAAVPEVSIVANQRNDDPNGCACDFRMGPANDELGLQYVCKSFAVSKALLTEAVKVCEDTTSRSSFSKSGSSVFATHVRLTHDMSGALLSKRVTIYGPSYRVSVKKENRAKEIEAVKLHANWCLYRAYVALCRMLRMDALAKGLLSAAYPGALFDQKPVWRDVFPEVEGLVLPVGVTLLADYDFFSAASKVKSFFNPCLEAIVAFQHAVSEDRPIEAHLEGCAFCGDDICESVHARCPSICSAGHASCVTCRGRWAYVCNEFFMDPHGIETPPCPCCPRERAAKRARVV
jgi:hypothetical protein